MSKRSVINKIEIEVNKITSGFSFIQETKTILKTANTIKIRLDITEECFTQVYRNIQKDLISYVTVVGRNRIFGRDCYNGVWHRHPEENPDSHDFSTEGSRKVNLDEFLFEVQEILLKMGIL